MFFNLFPRSFNDIEWVRGIPDLVRNAGVPCEKVVLEITEREALPNLTQVRAVIEELRESKIAVALDERDRVMVAHINGMAHEFGLKTVAEFVEDEMTAKMLAEMGVDYAQGYYFGRPALPE